MYINILKLAHSQNLKHKHIHLIMFNMLNAKIVNRNMITKYFIQVVETQF